MDKNFIQTCSNDMFNSSKGKIYRTFQLDFGCEKYLEKLSNKFRTILLKFRTTNHRLPVETGRWINMPYNDRSCVLCNTSKIADEFHYILEWSALTIIRKEYLHRYYIRPNVDKFYEIMSSSNVKTLKKLCLFILNYEFVCPL